MLVKQCKNQLTLTHTETNPTFQCDWTLQIQPTKNKLIKRKCPFCWRDLFFLLFYKHHMRIYDANLALPPLPLTPPPLPLVQICYTLTQTHRHTHTRIKELTHTRSTRIIKWNNTEKKKVTKQWKKIVEGKVEKQEKSLTLISLKKIK